MIVTRRIISLDELLIKFVNSRAMLLKVLRPRTTEEGYAEAAAKTAAIVCKQAACVPRLTSETRVELLEILQPVLTSESMETVVAALQPRTDMEAPAATADALDIEPASPEG